MKKMKYRIIGEEVGEGADENEIYALSNVEQGADGSSTPGELLGAEIQLVHSWSRGGGDPGSSRSYHCLPPLLWNFVILIKERGR